MHYSVTELEMTGLLVNMGLWKSIIRHREFDAAVDHAAVVQILKAKAKLATTQIKRLLECLASYSFNLYYVKGKDMILADYLSRHRRRHDDPNDLIPISFCLTCPANPASTVPVCLPMMTRRSAKAVGVEPPPVYGADKTIDPHQKPEHQRPTPKNQTVALPPAMASIPALPSKPKSRTQEIASKLLDRSKNINRRHSQKPVLIPPTAPRMTPHPTPVTGHPPQPQPPGHPMQTAPPIMPRQNQLPQADARPYPNDAGDLAKYTKRRIERAQCLIPGVDLGEEEEVIDPEVRMPNDVDFIKPPPLEELVDPTQTKHSFIPKQGELNKLLQQINTRILQGTHLVQDLRDLKAAYLASPHFHDIYIYLCQNKVLLNRLAAR